MRSWTLPGMVVLTSAVIFASGNTGLVHAQSAPQTLVIGVDHSDPANQRPDEARVFEYTDFFARDVAVHSGDTVDFRWAPATFHIVALAPSEQTARAVYPLAIPDLGDKPAKGTGLPKIQLGTGNGPIMGGSASGGGQIGGPNDSSFCGITVMGQKPCTFSGGADIESSGGVAGFGPPSAANPNGGPMPVDWMVQVTAPVGDYDFFCYIHPGMTGKLHVVDRGSAASSQADIDARGEQQFQVDQAMALQVEQQYNVDRPTTDGSTVTHHVSVGVGTPDNHVAIDEMLPHTIRVSQGDQVEFKWRDTHNVHTVGFAQAEAQLPQTFPFDCGATVLAPPNPNGPGGGVCFESGDAFPEVVADPGNALSGVILRDVQQIVDSGLLVGAGYGAQPTMQTWSVRTDKKTQSGAYQYWCTLHDFMNGQLLVGQ